METSPTKSSANNWLVIGYGNTLRGDDRFGAEVVHDFIKRGFGHLAQAICVHQLLPELIDSISRVGNVIFVDVSNDLSPGTLEVLDLKQLLDHPVEPTYTFSHYYTPINLLKNARELYQSTPNAWLYTVGGIQFDFAESLSMPLKNIVAEISQLIAQQIQSSSVSATPKG